MEPRREPSPLDVDALRERDAAAEQPAVLVVEDHPELLRWRLTSLAQRGVPAIGATRAEQAAAFLASGLAPIALVLIDVNLRPDDPSDRSGLALARLVRSAGLEVDLVGYSAHFEDGSISATDRGQFSSWIEKGRMIPTELVKRYDELAQDAARTPGAVMPRSGAAGEALVSFLAETQQGATDEVSEARAYLRASIGVRAYDPLDESAGTAGYDPLPMEVIHELLIADPEVTSP